MTKEQQRIAIAEACGWQFIPEYYHGKDDPPEFTTVTPDGRHLCGYYPDYLNDLNAMHEAEKVLINEQDLKYSESLALVVKARWKTNNSYDMQKFRSATAAQRAEAFLRTIGKWEEAQ